ncbi:MAG: acyltransferase [Deltaproteobacteria bacterium]|nr:acyltransferase [Deltaproteobacteria bacterium]
MNFFINHYNQHFPIVDPKATGLFIGSCVLLAVCISMTRRTGVSRFWDVQQTNILRGIAILCIILKHVDDFLIQGDKCFPLYLATYGVALFFFLSGYGLMRSWEQKRGGLTRFAGARIRRVFIPYLIVTVLVLILDYALLSKVYPLQDVLLALLGVTISQAGLFLNGPAWFITMLLFFYGIFIASILLRNPRAQLLFIVSCPVIVFYAGVQSGILGKTVDGFILMSCSHYLLMFPLGCCAARYYDVLSRLAGYAASTRSKTAAVMCVLAALFVLTRLLQLWSHVHPNGIYFLAAFNLHCITAIACASFAVHVLASWGLTSGFLALVGGLSYEMFLLHWPFMVKYDFILFRMPLKFSFVFYFGILLLLAYFLRKISFGIPRRRSS